MCWWFFFSFPLFRNQCLPFWSLCCLVGKKIWPPSLKFGLTYQPHYSGCWKQVNRGLVYGRTPILFCPVCVWLPRKWFNWHNSTKTCKWTVDITPCAYHFLSFFLLLKWICHVHVKICFWVLDICNRLTLVWVLINKYPSYLNVYIYIYIYVLGGEMD